MTIQQVHKEYERQWLANQQAYKDNPKGKVPQIDYAQLGADLVQALQEPPHSFSKARAEYIVSCAESEKHSCYDNVFNFVELLSRVHTQGARIILSARNHNQN